MQAERLQLGQRLALGRRHVRLADVGVGVEDVVVGRRDVHVAAARPSPPGPPRPLAQRAEPGELVLVVVRARRAPVRDVHRDDADAAARGGDGARLRVREARARPRSRAPRRPARRARGSRRRSRPPRRGWRPRSRASASSSPSSSANASSASFVSCRQTTSGLALVQPRQQPRQPLLDRIDVPGRDAHGTSRYRPRCAEIERRLRELLGAKEARLGKRSLPRVTRAALRAVLGEPFRIEDSARREAVRAHELEPEILHLGEGARGRRNGDFSGRMYEPGY